MKILFISLLSSFLLLSSEQTVAQDVQKATLEIRVTNIKKIKGNLLVAVFNDASKFLKDFSIAKRKKIENKEHLLIFNDLPHGTYAVSIFQDVNENNALDNNFLGIPKEPYGFSNNPSTFFGPPNFEKASFKINKENLKITIEL